MTSSTWRPRVTRAVRSSAAGAMFAQLWQAAGSFGLQILAAHLLGATGLGSFALCFGIIIMATALVGGVVGDSLTVLDREDRGIRAALQWWALLLMFGSSVVGSVALVVTGMLTVPQGVAFAAAALLFQAEEILRRLFMAELRFWRLVVVDTTALVVALAVVAFSSIVATVSLTTLLVGLAVGQAGACLVALAMLPATERRVVSLRGSSFGAVAAFGGWRGAQVAINPGVLTVFRTVVIVAAGTAALGEIEAARILVAPAILLVQGLGSYLLASYARDKAAPLPVLVSRAKRAAVVMSVSLVVASVIAALAVPYVGRLVAGNAVPISALTVFCWGLYAAASATLQPFASLCAARGRQRAVFLVRLVDSGVGLSLAAAGLLLFQMPATVAPVTLAIGLVVGGILVRVLVLRPLLMQPPAPSATDSQRLHSSVPRSQAVSR